jgi:hypothetical protein
MSIGILISVHDGIVLAADSASTLTLAGGPDRPQSVNFQSNTDKVVNLYKKHPIGCVPYGAGCIGDAAMASLLREFRESIMNPADADFSVSTYTVECVARRLTSFLMSHVSGLAPAQPKPTFGMMVAGYSAGQRLPEAWQISIENGAPKDLKRLRAPGEIGIDWGGNGEAISRMVHGFSESLPDALAQMSLPSEHVERLTQAMLARAMEVPLVFAPMPVHDAIDLAEWLVQTATMFSRFTPGSASAGGPVEMASITRFEGFKWIRRKHYYQNEMNPRS